MMTILKPGDLNQLKQALEPFFVRDFFRFAPFSPLLLEFCEKLSKELFNLETAVQDGKVMQYPDLASLAFWLRNKHLQHIQNTLATSSSNTQLVPRGLVFHIPPSHIDVMLVYSWICSLLMGNGTIIRLSNEQSEESKTLLNIILEVLAEKKFAPLAEITCFVQYGHEEEFTAWISSYAHVRVIWGGNDTIDKIRKIPLQPFAKELTFPDRFSYAVVDAKAFMQADKAERKTIVSHFFNDTYWYDQSACSSPRLICWIGISSMVEQASQDFYQTLQNVIQERGYEISLGTQLYKQAFMYDAALSLSARKVTTLSNELSILFVEELSHQLRNHCGQGLLYHAALSNLDGISAFVSSHDQTLSYYGFSQEELKKLASKINGKGLSRFVPFGQALTFETIWDGQNLLTEFSQTVTID